MSCEIAATSAGAGVAAGDVDSTGRISACAPIAVHCFARRRPARRRAASPSAPPCCLCSMSASRAGAGSARARRTRSPPRRSGRRCAPARVRRVASAAIWSTSSRPTRPTPSRMMSVPLRAAADLAAAHLVQVEGGVHGAQRGGRLAAVDDERDVALRRALRDGDDVRLARPRRRRRCAPRCRACATMPEPTTAIVARPRQQLDVVDLAARDLLGERLAQRGDGARRFASPAP